MLLFRVAALAMADVRICAKVLAASSGESAVLLKVELEP